MSERPASFRDVIELWPSKDAMAADVKAKPSTVSKWWQRNSIPAEWWKEILSTPVARRNSLKAEIFAGFAARNSLAEARA